MAAFTTALTEFSDKENSRTYVVDVDHSFANHALVLQTRKMPTGNQTIMENKLQVKYGHNDAEGNPFTSDISFLVAVRVPRGYDIARFTAAKTKFLDLVGSDEFGSLASSGLYLK